MTVWDELREEENQKEYAYESDTRKRFVQAKTKGGPEEQETFKRLTGKGRNVSVWDELRAEEEHDSLKKTGVNIEQQIVLEEETPEQRPVEKEDGVKAWWTWLHTEQKDPEGVWDFLTRIVPTDAVQATTGIIEFPYHLAKTITDPLALLMDDYRGEIGRFEKSIDNIHKRRELERWRSDKNTDSLTGEILQEVWETNKRMSKHIIDRYNMFREGAYAQADGTARFFGEGLGLYGWDKFKDKWTTQPVSGLLGLMPLAKAGRGSLPTKKGEGPPAPAPKPTTKVEKALQIVEEGGKDFIKQLDIQANFPGTPKTGDAFRSYNSIKQYEMNIAKQAVKDKSIRKLGIEDSVKAYVESHKPANKRVGSKEVLDAAQKFENYSKEAANRLIKDGILTDPWPQSLLKANHKKAVSLTRHMKRLRKVMVENKTTVNKNQYYNTDQVVNIAVKQKKYKVAEKKYNIVKKERDILLKTNKEIVGIDPKYSPIPLDPWQRALRESLGETLGDRASNNIFKKNKRFFKKRTTINPGALVKDFMKLETPEGKPAIPRENFTIQGVMAEYAQSIGEKRAMARVFNAAKKEGLIVKETGKLPIYKQEGGWYWAGKGPFESKAKASEVKRAVEKKRGTEPPPGYGHPHPDLVRTFPELKNKYVHDNFADFGGKFFKHVDGTSVAWRTLGRALSYTKIATFNNPFILPMNSFRQNAWSGMYMNVVGPNRFTKNIAKGVKSVLTKDKYFHRATDGATFSVPYTPPFLDFKKEMMATMRGDFAKRALTVLKDRAPITGNPFKLVDDFMRAVWNTAWPGDQMARMSQWHYYKGKGFSDKEASQWTAFNCGDYAAIPPRTRNFFKYSLYTPSFKVSMGRAQAKMLNSAVVYSRNALLGKKTSARDAQLAKGALMLGGAVMAQDWVMKHAFGYETDETGLRYSKEVDTEKGKKEHIVYIATPENVWMREVLRWSKWRMDGKFAYQAMDKSQWTLHPLYRTMIQVANNSSGNSEDPYVYNMFDNDARIAADIIRFSVRNIFRATEMVENVATKRSPREAQRVMQKELGALRATFLKATSLAYLRHGKDVRRVRAIENLSRQFARFSLYDPPKNEEQFLTRQENFLEKVEDVMREFERESKEDKPREDK